MRNVLFGAAASILAMNLAFAQTAATSPSAAPGTTTTTTNQSTTGTGGTSMGAPPAPNTSNNKAAASGNDNQAVVTTGANADQPAKGANSFSKGQARYRIAKKGYTHVTGLAKDHDGVWRGSAMKDGQTVQVWLDYKGNVGQQS